MMYLYVCSLLHFYRVLNVRMQVPQQVRCAVFFLQKYITQKRIALIITIYSSGDTILAQCRAGLLAVQQSCHAPIVQLSQRQLVSISAQEMHSLQPKHIAIDSSNELQQIPYQSSIVQGRRSGTMVKILASTLSYGFYGNYWRVTDRTMLGSRLVQES